MDPANYINCGFDFENSFVVKDKEKCLFRGSYIGEVASPLSKYIGSNFVCLSDHITITSPDENNKVIDINVAYADTIIGAGCCDI